MSNIFLVSDHHFGHENILKFKYLDGVTLIRPEFSSVEHMNEEMIRRHNMVVTDNDKVYFLGDVAFNAKVFHSVMPRLKGKKSLILGNHDKLRPDDYLKYFKNIYSARFMGDVEPKLVLCHYPLHINANHPNHPICVHGHIHEKEIECTREMESGHRTFMKTGPDPAYFNVSVEKIDYTPIELSELVKRIKGRIEQWAQ